MRCGRSTIARVAVLLLALYIVVDFGTPLLPGAFRFEMSQSIEAGGRPGVRLAGSVAHDALAPNPVPAVRAELTPVADRSRPPDVAVPRVVEVLRPARVDSPPDPLDDH
jgi:hypothetical protein